MRFKLFLILMAMILSLAADDLDMRISNVFCWETDIIPGDLRIESKYGYVLLSCGNGHSIDQILDDWQPQINLYYGESARLTCDNLAINWQLYFHAEVICYD